MGGSAGEAAGQLVSEGKITSPSEVLIEGVAELGVGGAQQSALSGINMLKDKQVQQDLKETQSKSDELRNAREKEVLDAYNAELEAQQTVDPELGPMTEVEGSRSPTSMRMPVKFCRKDRFRTKSSRNWMPPSLVILMKSCSSTMMTTQWLASRGLAGW